MISPNNEFQRFDERIAPFLAIKIYVRSSLKRRDHIGRSVAAAEHGHPPVWMLLLEKLDLWQCNIQIIIRYYNQKNSIISLKRIWGQVAQAGRRRQDTKVRIAEDVRQALSQESMRPDENDAERLTPHTRDSLKPFSANRTQNPPLLRVTRGSWGRSRRAADKYVTRRETTKG